MTEVLDPWAMPQVVSDVRLVFPATVTEDLLPPWDDIPEEFKDDSHTWAALPRLWFAAGLHKDCSFFMREGIDGETAWRHVSTVMGSYEPKHQHKIAGVAYLLSRWCTGAVYTASDDDFDPPRWKTAGTVTDDEMEIHRERAAGRPGDVPGGEPAGPGDVAGEPDLRGDAGGGPAGEAGPDPAGG